MAFETISYKFIAAAALTAAKTPLFRMAGQMKGYEADYGKWTGDESDAAIGVYPKEYEGKYYETDLSLGLDENADTLRMEEAVCSVSKAKNIIQTPLAGLAGTIKEYVSDGDYDLSITVGLAAVEDGHIVDKYPEQGVKDLRALLDSPKPLYVDSAFLQIFGINRIVIKDYSIQQMTYCNRQTVTIRALSDDDYTIKCNEY